VQIFLMMFVGNARFNLRPGVRVCPLEWNDGQSLNDILKGALTPFEDEVAANPVTVTLGTGSVGNVHVGGGNAGTVNVGNVNMEIGNAGTGNARPDTSSSDGRFSDFFNLRDMERLAGFEIYPTHNLLDHLLIIKHPERRFTSRVYVFYHASVLKELMLGYVKLNEHLNLNACL
jgi:hypothetical protein